MTHSELFEIFIKNVPDAVELSLNHNDDYPLEYVFEDISYCLGYRELSAYVEGDDEPWCWDLNTVNGGVTWQFWEI